MPIPANTPRFAAVTRLVRVWGSLVMTAETDQKGMSETVYTVPQRM